MVEVRTRLVPDLIGDAGLCDAVAECWLDVSNAGGAVGFPFPPVLPDQARKATQRLAQDVAAGRLVVFVAELEEVLVGWVALRLNSSSHTRHWGSVQRLQSRPECRHVGVGRQLMDTLAEHARSIGLEHLHLVLRGGQNLEAFYTLLGWSEVGRHRAALRFSDGVCDEVAMLLELSN